MITTLDRGTNCTNQRYRVADMIEDVSTTSTRNGTGTFSVVLTHLQAQDPGPLHRLQGARGRNRFVQLLGGVGPRDPNCAVALGAGEAGGAEQQEGAEGGENDQRDRQRVGTGRPEVVDRLAVVRAAAGRPGACGSCSRSTGSRGCPTRSRCRCPVPEPLLGPLPRRRSCMAAAIASETFV
jgi:hypothetical protein